MSLRPSLYKDLMRSAVIEHKVQDRDYSKRLYAALCNIQWFQTSLDPEQLEEKDIHTFSWRSSGGVLADLRGVGEDYMDFYCSGGEGKVDKEVEQDLLNIGWRWREYPARSP